MALTFDRLEAVFSPPGRPTDRLRALLDHIRANPQLDAVFERVCRESEVARATPGLSPGECKAAFETRCRLVEEAATNACGMVDVIDLGV